MKESSAAANGIIILLLVVIAFMYFMKPTPKPADPEVKIVVEPTAAMLTGDMVSWHDTLVDVNGRVTITAGGFLSYENGHGSDLNFSQISPMGFSGDPGGTNGTHLMTYFRPLVEGLPFYALVGKIGDDGTPFFVGTHITTSGTGRLYFILNSVDEKTSRDGTSNFGYPMWLKFAGHFTFEVKPSQQPVTQQFFVSATKLWQATGFTVTKPRTFYAYGMTTSKPSRWGKYGMNEEVALFKVVGPEGWADPIPDIYTVHHKLVPTCPYMSLVGRVGDHIFCMGSQETVSTQGPLYAAINDIYTDSDGVIHQDWFDENEGGFTIRGDL